MNIEYPMIRYGRRALGGNADCYDVVSKSPEFPDDAERLFRQQVCQSVEWTCGDNDRTLYPDRYPDSFLFWKLSAGRVLVARLTDAGCDSRGRPHALSIEAIVVGTDNVDRPMAEFLARLMYTPDWTYTPDWSGGTLSEVPGETRHVENLERYIKSDAISLLLASHPNFHVSGINLICSPERAVTNRSKPPPPVMMTQRPNPQIKPLDTEEREGAQPLVIVSILLLLGTVVLGGLLYYSHTELESANSALVETKKQLAEMNHELEEANRQKEWATNELATIDQKLQEKEKALKTAESEIGGLRRLLDMRSSDRERMFMQRNQHYEESLQQMPDIVRDRLLEEIQRLLNNALGEEE